jgi:hypothetical protein
MNRQFSGEEAGQAPAAARPAEVVALRDLLEFGRTEVAAHLRADGEPDFRILVVGFFSRVTTTLQALVLLVENDFGQQAVMLNRVTFELMVDTYWINANRELAADRFVQHARFDQHLKRETAGRYPDLLEGLDVYDEHLDEAELADLSKLYGRHGMRSWTGLSVYDRVEAIAESFIEPRDREQLRSFRDVVHRLDNQELHPTTWSIARVLRRRPAEDGRAVFQYRIAPEPDLGSFAVRCAWWIYLQMLHVLIEIFDMPLDDALAGLKETAPWAAEQ